MYEIEQNEPESVPEAASHWFVIPALAESMFMHQLDSRFRGDDDLED